MALCSICPRSCGIDRSVSRGFCREGDRIRVAKIMHHHWEEPCISGGSDGAGSGAIFFSGCSLKCVYCQNRDISRGDAGEVMSVKELADAVLRLQDEGAHNVNFVTPTHFTEQIKAALDIAKPSLSVPVVWNTSGYEKAETVRGLKGYADIFLTDFKYFSSELSSRYSAAPDYAERAAEALCEMAALTGKPRFSEDGMLLSGVIVRHLVLPKYYKDSIKVLELVKNEVGSENVLLSLMAQFTPDFTDKEYPELCRRITTFEYEKVLSAATSLGFDGYAQERGSALSAYTPDFSQGGNR